MSLTHLMMTWRRRARGLVLGCGVLLLAGMADGGVVKTLDGKSYEGELKLEQDGVVSVLPAGGSAVKVELSNILVAVFKSEPVRTQPVVVENGKLPTPWESKDVGEGTDQNSAKYTNGIFSVKSAGGELKGKKDSFAFVQQAVGGDADLVARIVDVKEASKVVAGVMFRNDGEADSAYAAVGVAEGGVVFAKRIRKGAGADVAVIGRNVAFPVWVKMSRRGNLLTAYTSKDGTNWEKGGSETIGMERKALAGLAVCGRGEQAIGSHLDSVKLSAVAASQVGVATMSSTLAEGILLRSGTLLARAEISRVEDGTVYFSKGERRDVKLPLVNVAKILFRETAVSALAKIPENRAGVLLREGDFVEGDLKAMKEGRVQLSSVLFGLAKFEVREKAVALVLNGMEAGRPQFVLRATDGSIYFASSMKFEKDKVTVEDASAGAFTLNRWEVAEISTGAGRLELLGGMKPVSVELMGKASGSSLVVDGTGAGVSMAVGNVVFEHGLTLVAGASATWDLEGRYRMLTFRAGVPAGVLPTASVRFVVTADGKELFKSGARTSRDEALAMSVAVKDAKRLTLKVESASSELIPTPGFWGDVSLVK